MQETVLLFGLGAAAAAAWLPALRTRLELSQAKHPSLTGHARIARRVAALVPYYAYDEERFFGSDGAPAPIVERRRAGFAKLAELYRQRYPRGAALTAESEGAISDLQFTSRYRVPFQYSRYLRQHLKLGAFLRSSEGVTVTDLDGNRFYDLAGSYGVNLFGVDFYKACISEGSARAAELGPVLGAYHPAVAYNVRRLREISGLDEVSFHMSGTEAVMQAVRLARFHTRRTHLVRFCGAYHGWWEGVQPGIGNPVPQRETYTLRDTCWSTRCRDCTPTRTRPPTDRSSTAREARTSTARRTRHGCRNCARCAPSAASCSSSTRFSSGSASPRAGRRSISACARTW